MHARIYEEQCGQWPRAASVEGLFMTRVPHGDAADSLCAERQ